MFTGIVEGLGKVVSIEKDQSNVHFEIECEFLSELKIDQSLAHNGACLTVVMLNDSSYIVTAIHETLELTNLGALRTGDLVNLERCLKIGDRLDGHMVQGHVDSTAVCTSVVDQNGSWKFSFQLENSINTPMIMKGSVTINGVSLTLIHVENKSFSVAIIPYTKEHTTFNTLKEGQRVNIEHDIFGKYVAAMQVKPRKILP